MNYYRRYVGDYLKKTSRLSILEHGAYCVMLDYYYAEERPLPSDLDEVYRLVRAMLPEERRAVDKILFTYFAKRADGWHNSRANEEMELARPAIDAARANGSKGGRPNRNNPEETQRDTCQVNGHEPNGIEAGIQPPTTSHQPPAANPQPPDTSPAIAGESKPAVSPCPHAEIIGLYAKHLPMGRQVKPPWAGERAKHLQARWREFGERQSTAWWDEFFEHCAKSRFLTGRAAPRRQGEKPFEVSLDWIVSPGNFQKIVEGAYDE